MDHRIALPGAAFLLACAGAQASQLPRLLRVEGDAPGDWFGYAVAPMGDVDGDRVPDFAVGAHQNVHFATSTQPGYARVFSGADGAILHTFTGDGPHWYYGHALDGGADLDGDGPGDLLVGGYEEEQVRVHSGADGALLHSYSGNPTERDGFSLAWLPDLDGDGKPEYAVGAMKSDIPSMNAGSVRVHSGADHSVLHLFQGEAEQAGLGWSTRPAGDVDGDGVPDLIAGAVHDARGALRPGSATVYSLRTGAVLWRWFGDADGDSFGFSVDGAGDVDGDGRADLVVGAIQSTLSGSASGPGYARVFSGRDGSLLHEFRGEARTDQLGFRVRGAGDLNGDGHADLLIGAPRAVSLGFVPTGHPGYVRLHSGRDGALLYTFLGDAADDQFGVSLAVLDDLDGDGLPEFLMGACEDVADQTRRGYAAVTSGRYLLSARYCVAAPSSLGEGALLDHTGSLSLGQDDLGLRASPCPPSSFGSFFAGRNAIELPFGDGFLCVGGGVNRLGTVGTGALGVATLDLDLSALRLGGAPIAPGSTWRFQFWYRDVAAGAGGFNLSDALAITFAE